MKRRACMLHMLYGGHQMRNGRGWMEVCRNKNGLDIFCFKDFPLFCKVLWSHSGVISASYIFNENISFHL